MLNNKLTKIGEDSFENCTNLSSINLPSTLTAINKSAFFGCTKLESIVLPESLETISDIAFASTGLKKIIIPLSVKSIGRCAFPAMDSINCRALSKPDGWNEDWCYYGQPTGINKNIVWGYTGQ